YFAQVITMGHHAGHLFGRTLRLHHLQSQDEAANVVGDRIGQSWAASRQRRGQKGPRQAFSHGIPLEAPSPSQGWNPSGAISKCANSKPGATVQPTSV